MCNTKTNSKIKYQQKVTRVFQYIRNQNSDFCAALLQCFCYLNKCTVGRVMGYVLILSFEYDNYRPHPKDDGRLYFHFVCQSTHGGGGTWSQVWGGTPSQVGGVPGLRSGGYPISGPGGYPVSGPGGTQSQVWGGTPSQVRGVPWVPPSKGKNF